MFSEFRKTNGLLSYVYNVHAYTTSPIILGVIYTMAGQYYTPLNSDKFMRRAVLICMFSNISEKQRWVRPVH